MKPLIRRRQELARTRIFRIDELELEFGNGRLARFEVLRSAERASVLIVPLLDPRTVLLVREYAAAYDRYELGFPKGLLEADEDMLEGANRELMEEVGHSSRDLQYLRTVTLAPGYVDHQTHIILARDLSCASLPGDEPEELEAIPWPLDQAEQLLQRNDFTEARSIAALFLIRDSINHER